MRHNLEGKGKIIKKETLTKKRLFLLAVPIIVILVFFIFVAINISNQNNVIQNIKEQSKIPHTKLLVLWYPPTILPQLQVLNITSPSNPQGTITTIFPFSPLIILSWNGTLTEKTPVNITATCDLPSQWASEDKDIASIAIGIEGAQPYNPNTTITEFSTTSFDLLILNRGTPDGNGGVWLNGTSGQNSDIVTFESEGDFSPTMVVSHYSTMDYTIQGYPDYKVHVFPSATVQQEQDEQITMATNVLTIYLTYGLFALAGVEGAYLVWDHLPKNEEENIDMKIEGSTFGSGVSEPISNNPKDTTTKEEKPSEKKYPFWNIRKKRSRKKSR